MRSASAANATQPLSLFSSLLSAPPLEIHLHASLCTKIAVPSNNDDRSGASPETRAIRIELYSLSDQTNDLLQGGEGNKGGLPPSCLSRFSRKKRSNSTPIRELED